MLEMILTSYAEKVEPRNLIPMGVRCDLRAPRSPSPQPSPWGRERIAASRSANRESCELSRAGRSRCWLFLRTEHSSQVLYSLPQSRRDCVLQPRVASSELPWVNCVGRCQPQRGCGLRSRFNCRNPVGVDRTRAPFPRVARCSQPWALSRNPVGIRPPDSSSCGECTTLREGAGVRGNKPYFNPKHQMATKPGRF
jgi:hypothetical protein